MRETLERLLATVTDEDLETLRDAILREEGRRHTLYRLTITMPFPPLESEEDHATTVNRWARLLAWMSHQAEIPPASGQRGVNIKFRLPHTLHAPAAAGILIQQAMVEAGLLLGRTPEWMTATRIEVEHAPEAEVRIEMWERQRARLAQPWSEA